MTILHSYGGIIDNDTSPPQKGWVCPKCNGVNSPTAPYCWHCKAKEVKEQSE